MEVVMGIKSEDFVGDKPIGQMKWRNAHKIGRISVLDNRNCSILKTHMTFHVHCDMQSTGIENFLPVFSKCFSLWNKKAP